MFNNNHPVKNKILAILAVLPVVLGFAGCQQASEPSTTTTTPAATTQTVIETGDVVVGQYETDLYILKKTAPATVVVGEPFTYTYELTAKQDISDVAVRDTVPAGATLVSTEPQSQGGIAWTVAKVKKGETKTMKATMSADQVTTLANCATATATPVACTEVVVAQAKLGITKTVDKPVVIVGEQAVFTITVSNPGNFVAKNVVVADKLPEGLIGTDGKTEYSLAVGDLAAGETKTAGTIPVVTQKRGEFTNVAQASASNVKEKPEAQATIKTMTKELAVEKTGPKQEYANKQATYTIKVTNPGDTDLENVVITDSLPGAYAFVSATKGGVAQGQVVTWTLPRLAAGSSDEVALTIGCATLGSFVNNVTAAANGLTKEANATTEWIGVPGLLLEVVDNVDPITVGGTTTYTITVTNQGQVADTNVKLVGIVPSTLEVVSVTGGKVEAGKVDFDNIPTLAGKQSVTYTVTVKAKDAGNALFEVQMKSDIVAKANPVREYESTSVY